MQYYDSVPKRYNKTNQYLTTPYLASVCVEYANTYGNDTTKPVRISEEDRKIAKLEGTGLLECKFAIEAYEDDEVIVVFTGTIDEISEVQGGLYLVTDAKTSSKWNIDEYLEGYSINKQLMFYINAIHLHALKYPDSIFVDMVKRGIGGQIDGIFLAGKDRFTLKRSRVFIFKDEMFTEFKAMLDTAVRRAVDIVLGRIPLRREGILYNLCSVYNGCEYYQLCAAPDNGTAEIIRSQIYKQETYNPLTFQ